MKLVVRGSGNTHGIPKAGCACPACAAAHAGRGVSRQATCALAVLGGWRLAIDGGLPGLAALAPAAVLLTHFHPDHIQGLAAECAAFTAPLPVHAPADGERSGRLFDPPGRLVPVPAEPFRPLAIGPYTATAVPLSHPVPTVGWVIDGGGRRIAWLCDTRGLPADTAAFLAADPPDLAVVDCSFAPGDPLAALKQHGDLDDALAALAASGARQGLLAHLDHTLQAWIDAQGWQPPDGVRLAHDGLVA
ncbi:MAG: MBL fold metallo-hydrolase [Planctomycetes bacterium]|nr:MBL fold metallo-hydrolase [Planctomycetota bacterium]